MSIPTVAIVGRANVGKSTFLNAVLGEPLAIVSARPQTTRHNLLGVISRPDAQLAFFDTPGLHKPHSEIGRRMNAAAFEAARLADVLLFMTDIDPARSQTKALELDPEDLSLVARLPERTPATLELCLAIHPDEPDRAQLLARGWRLATPEHFRLSAVGGLGIVPGGRTVGTHGVPLGPPGFRIEAAGIFARARGATIIGQPRRTA